MASYLARAALGAIVGYIAVPLFGSASVSSKAVTSTSTPAHSPPIDAIHPNTLITSVTAQETATASAVAATETVTVTNFVLAPDLTRTFEKVAAADYHLKHSIFSATLLLCAFLAFNVWQLYDLQVQVSKQRDAKVEGSKKQLKKQLTDLEKAMKIADIPVDTPALDIVKGISRADYNRLNNEIDELRNELELWKSENDLDTPKHSPTVATYGLGHGLTRAYQSTPAYCEGPAHTPEAAGDS